MLEWLFKADEDFAFATGSLERELEYYGPICLHFHEAGEKYLKAYIVAFELPFGKIHDLEKLVAVCAAHDASFSVLVESARALNPFYTEVRYPGETYIRATKALAIASFENAEQIQRFVREKLGIHEAISAEDIQRENMLVDEELKKQPS